MRSARREPAGVQNKPPNGLYVFEHKTWYILIHAPHTRTLAFWQPMIMIFRYNSLLKFALPLTTYWIDISENSRSIICYIQIKLSLSVWRTREMWCRWKFCLWIMIIFYLICWFSEVIYGMIKLDQHWSVNGLVPDGTKSLPEPMLIYHQWSPVLINTVKFH